MASPWAEILIEDHATTERVFVAVENAFESESGPSPSLVKGMMAYFSEYLDGCHNRKEEEHLFPLAEKRGIPRYGGPLAVMLQEHEQSKALLARIRQAGSLWLSGREDAYKPLRAAVLQYTELLRNHFWKETDILYPMVSAMMSADDHAAVLRGIEAVEASLGGDTRARYYAMARDLAETGGLRDLAYGLDHATLAAMLNTLPVELSFIDAGDVVRYFSHEEQAKIFPRTRGAIGTNVRNCHPEKSLPMVERILADFKAGTRKVAEFWIPFEGKFVHIRYFPVRGPDGAYLGCMEVVQDVTGIRALQGERRLLAEG